MRLFIGGFVVGWLYMAMLWHIITIILWITDADRRIAQLERRP